MTPKSARPAPNVVVGERVKARRLELGWSQRHLAYVAKVATSYISLLEGGHVNPGLNTLADIAFALGINMGALTADLLPRDLRGLRARLRKGREDAVS
jgi:transcriptional regulator with XRE-family HTH domain